MSSSRNVKKTYKLRPATTLLSMSQRFAAIRKMLPLGTLNINPSQDIKMNNSDNYDNNLQSPDTHSGPYAQYKPDVFVPLMSQRPVATLQEGSAQNRFILQRLQEAMGRAAEPFPRRTLSSSNINKLSSATSISMSSRTTENIKQYASSVHVHGYEESGSSSKSDRLRKSTESIRKTIRVSSRKNESSSRKSEPSSRSKKSILSRISKQSPPSHKKREQQRSVKSEPRRKSLSERLGRISVFNRLGSPTKKPIHERLSYTSPESRRSIDERLEVPRAISTVETSKFKARNRKRKPRSSRGGRLSTRPSSRRRVSTEDLNNDLDDYMATD